MSGISIDLARRLEAGNLQDMVSTAPIVNDILTSLCAYSFA